MPRKKLSDDQKMKPIPVSVDPTVYKFAMAQPNSSKWINACCRAYLERHNLLTMKPKNKKIKTTGFDAWFSAQFSNLPMPDEDFENLTRQLFETQSLLNALQRKNDEELLLRIQYRSSRYAWNILDEKKASEIWE